MVVLLTILCFISGAVPYSYIVGKLFIKKDIRNYGDGNPGSANVIRAGGWLIGLLAAILDFGKGFIPVIIIKQNMSDSSLALIPILIAPILGHAFTPFLRFKGGKAVAVTYGVWMAYTNFDALPFIGISMLIFTSIQKQDAWSVVAGFLIFGAYPIFIIGNTVAISLFLTNLSILIYKHYKDLKGGILPRDWVTKLIGVGK
ncbi:MAG: glycerol-3-phosphate acyltransferase [Candidatus Marinimicrobia bacterium]|nr:glycerol-3-phosphate acyltransferase [Candidatus Neomarinimicrobiota bacterium]